MAVKEYNLDQPMDKLIDRAERKFGAVEFQPVSVGDDIFHVLQIKNMQLYINKLMDQTRAGKSIALPLWAKIWPSSLVMSHSLLRFPLSDGSSILEIGGGAALCSMALARRGYTVNVADTDPDALLFSQINALKNGLSEKIQTISTDFKDGVGYRFECVIGSELLYDESQFDQLAGFLDKVVQDEGEVFLSLDLKRAAKNFFMVSSEKFNITKSSATFKNKESGEDKPINLFRFKRK